MLQHSQIAGVCMAYFVVFNTRTLSWRPYEIEEIICTRNWTPSRQVRISIHVICLSPITPPVSLGTLRTPKSIWAPSIVSIYYWYYFSYYTQERITLHIFFICRQPVILWATDDWDFCFQILIREYNTRNVFNLPLFQSQRVTWIGDSVFAG